MNPLGCCPSLPPRPGAQLWALGWQGIQGSWVLSTHLPSASRSGPSWGPKRGFGSKAPVGRFRSAQAAPGNQHEGHRADPTPLPCCTPAPLRTSEPVVRPFTLGETRALISSAFFKKCKSPWVGSVFVPLKLNRVHTSSAHSVLRTGGAGMKTTQAGTFQAQGQVCCGRAIESGMSSCQVL